MSAGGYLILLAVGSWNHRELVVKAVENRWKSNEVHTKKAWEEKSLQSRQTGIPWMLTASMKRIPSLALKLLETDISSYSEKAVQWPPLQQRRKETDFFSSIPPFYVVIEALCVTIVLLSICSD